MSTTWSGEDSNLPVMKDIQCTGRELGAGTYGMVYEVQRNGEIYVGKVYIAKSKADPGFEKMMTIFRTECKLMLDIKDDNITKFLGVCHFQTLSDFPVLVMEKLESNLHEYLQNKSADDRDAAFAKSVKRSILHDVAKGLVYLHEHNPPIIHRDLTARNILLTKKNVAKITDYRQCCILDQFLQPGPHCCQDGLSYLPPAVAFESDDKPDEICWDIFSFGHLALFTALEVFPGDLLDCKCPDNENTQNSEERTEVERRGKYFDQLKEKYPKLGDSHPLVILIQKCLSTCEKPPKRVKCTAADLESALEPINMIDHLDGLIAYWLENIGRSENTVRLVLAGKAGMGKSTLVNNILGLKGKNKADAGSGKSITTEVKEYEKKINGITVKIVDTPGLEASDLKGSKAKKMIADLNVCTKGEADLLMYCVSMTGGRVDKDDVNIIGMLNKAFSKSIWERCILVMTRADLVQLELQNQAAENSATQNSEESGDLVEKKDPTDSDSSEEIEENKIKSLEDETIKICKSFEDALKEAGVSDVQVQSELSEDCVALSKQKIVVGLTAGRSVKMSVLPKWEDKLLMEVIKRCNKNAMWAMLQLQGFNYKEFIHTKFTVGKFAGGGSSVVGVVGGVVGGTLGPPTALAGAAVGGAVGGAAGGALAKTLQVVLNRFGNDTYDYADWLRATEKRNANAS